MSLSWTRRDFLLRSTAVGAVVASTTLGGCTSKVGGTPAADSSARPRSTEPSTTSSRPAFPSSVTMGVVTYRPYAYKDESGEITGQVPTVARAVLEKLGASQVEMDVFDLPERILAGLAAGQFELAGGLFITPNRCGSTEFSIPDYVTLTALLTPAGNPKGLKTYAEVAATGARLAVLTSLPEREEAIAAGVAADKIVELPTPDLLANVVTAGEVDCVAFEDVTLRDIANTSDGTLAVSPGFTPAGRAPYVGAFMFPSGSTELLDAFNEGLRGLHESGEWLRLSERFGFTEDNLPGPDVTTEKACAGR